MADDTKPKSATEEYDIFISNTTYPEAEGIFSFKPRTIQEIKKDALVILDTNTLLVPYTVSKNSLDQIKQTYRKLIRQKRLIIPGQVAREFARNRANKLAELYQQLNRRRNLKYSSQGSYPLLDNLPEYQRVINLERQLLELEKEYIDAVGKILATIRSWSWDDPVSKLYRELFSTDVVYDPQLKLDEIKKDLKIRQVHKLPPGYKDAAKDDEGIGDLLIWYTILEIAADKKLSTMFISADQKPDWWCQSEGQALYPRYELVDEFRRASQGQTILMIRFSEMMEIFGAEESVVQEVRQEESLLKKYSTTNVEDIRKFASVAESAVLQWLIDSYPQSNIDFGDRPGNYDYLIVSPEGNKIGVEVKTFSSIDKISFERRIREWKHLAYYVVHEQNLERYLLVVVIRDAENLDTRILSRLRTSLMRTTIPKSEFVIGKLTDQNTLVVLDQISSG